MPARERPILFSAPMVRAILAGTKTQTRRIVKPQPYTLWGHGVPLPHVDKQRRFGVHAAFNVGEMRVDRWLPCPYGAPGDRLWVRETFGILTGNGIRTVYRADGTPMTSGGTEPVRDMKWHPSIFMRRQQSRITLEVTGVRVERLHDIDALGALAEGVEGRSVESVLDGKRGEYIVGSARDAFAALWDEINGKPSPMLDDDGEPVLDDNERPIMVASRAWATNPWVWVVEFRRVEVPT